MKFFYLYDDDNHVQMMMMMIMMVMVLVIMIMISRYDDVKISTFYDHNFICVCSR